MARRHCRHTIAYIILPVRSVSREFMSFVGAGTVVVIEIYVLVHNGVVSSVAVCVGGVSGTKTWKF